MMNTNFSEKLKLLRKNKGITQQALANAIGEKRSIIANYESNNSTPGFEVLNKLSNFFNVPVGYLTGKTNSLVSEYSFKTLEDYILTHQQQWSAIIADLNGKMKHFADLADLQNVIYSRRQDALDYYFGMLSKISSLSRDYKLKYSQKYNYYKTQAQIRYSSEAAINAQIDSDLKDDKYQIELLDQHTKYMLETIKTIDSIIYAINNRIRIEELINQVKK